MFVLGSVEGTNRYRENRTQKVASRATARGVWFEKYNLGGAIGFLQLPSKSDGVEYYKMNIGGQDWMFSNAIRHKSSMKIPLEWCLKRKFFPNSKHDVYKYSRN